MTVIQGEAFTGEVHPVADLFPMLTEDELDELAADIEERGLLQPIVLSEDGTLLDGRNRLEACRRAGVEPHFVFYGGEDAAGYALSVNIARRHLTKGQIAMVAAKACKETLHSTYSIGKSVGVSAQRITQANVVIQFAPDLVDGVVTGTPTLDRAYEEAQRRKAAAHTEEARLERLRATAPDWATRVIEEGIPLSEAEAAAAQREREEQERCERWSGYFVSSLQQLWGAFQPDAREQLLASWRPSLAHRSQMGATPELFTHEGLAQMGEWMFELAQQTKEKPL